MLNRVIKLKDQFILSFYGLFLRSKPNYQFYEVKILDLCREE